MLRESSLLLSSPGIFFSIFSTLYWIIITIFDHSCIHIHFYIVLIINIMVLHPHLLLSGLKRGDILSKVLEELSLALRKQQLVLVRETLSLIVLFSFLFKDEE